MIYYLCPDASHAVGGAKMIYRHVAALSDAGIEARVLHALAPFRCDWFDSSARVAWMNEGLAGRLRRRAGGLGFGRELSWYLRRLELGGRVIFDDGQQGVLTNDDILVLPEFYGARLFDAALGFKVVVFNQRAFGTFDGWGHEASGRESIYQREQTLGLMCVSEHNREYLTYAFPKARVVRTINGASQRFRCTNGGRGRTLAFMPRKLSGHVEQALQMLHSRGTLSGWQLLPIDGMSEEQVALELSKASIYLATSSDEGFGLPALEAGLAGCLLVGYHGYGGTEIFDPRYSWPVPQNDVLGLAQRLEEVMGWVEKNPAIADERRREFSELLAEAYSEEAERRSVVEAWRILGLPP
jgi:glycosyltransferase involved in cell wall biosynthesis